jgi:hypothetical protein
MPSSTEGVYQRNGRFFDFYGNPLPISFDSFGVGPTGPTGPGSIGPTGPYPFYFQSTPPTGIITNGSLWYHSITGKLYVYVKDEDSSQWVMSIGPI